MRLEPSTGVVRVAQSSCFSQCPPALENLQGDILIVQTLVRTGAFAGGFLVQEAELLRPCVNSGVLPEVLVLSWVRGKEVLCKIRALLAFFEEVCVILVTVRRTFPPFLFY